MNKSDIQKIVKKELDDLFNEQLKKHLKKPEIQKIIKNGNKESLINFVRALWTQRTFWDSKI